MLKKQNSNLVALATGLFFILADSHADIQKELDSKYTTKVKDKTVLMQEVRDLNDEEQDTFMLGKSFFSIPWVEAPSATTARDGLGPLFNSNTCINCHPKNGRASIFTKNKSLSRAYVTRLSIPANSSNAHQTLLKYSGFIADPMYGSQISINGVHGVAYEAKPLLTYDELPITYPDGSIVVLKAPVREIEKQLKDLQYGPLHDEVSITNRLAPALIGLGLLEKITDEQILKNQDINDSNKDGISGKANIVYSLEHKDFRVGRYTYKASVASVLEQSASAANTDMSLTNELYPNENCTKKQTDCLKAPKGDNLGEALTFDLPRKRLEAIEFYLRHLKIPKSTITQKEGEVLFAQIGCVKCHIPSFKLANGYKIKPFSDFLLHDMGEALSDGRVEFRATPREWRTMPLWGISKQILSAEAKPELLHDGRAKTIEEAILWHGGEAQEIKKNFMHLSKQERNKIINYIKEL